MIHCRLFGIHSLRSDPQRRTQACEQQHMINPSNPYIKIEHLICRPHIFPVEVVGLEEFVQVTIKFNFCDDVLNSHDRSV